MDPRDLVLARRAQFIAAALAATLGCSKSDGPPITAPADKTAQPKEDAGAPPSVSAPEDASAVPCLSVILPPDGGKFSPCLSMKPPDSGPKKPVDPL